MSDERRKQSRRGVESAVLAIVIERHPDPLARGELATEMLIAAGDSGRAVEVAEAIAGLIEVGLLMQMDDALHTTPAGLRAGELELGL